MTPEQQKVIDKSNKKRRDSLSQTVRRLRMQFSFKNVKSYGDAYRVIGYSPDHIATLPNKPEEPLDGYKLDELVAKLESDLESIIQKEQDERDGKLKAIVESCTPRVKQGLQERGRTTTESISVSLPTSFTPPKQEVKGTVQDDSGYTNSNNYGLTESPNEKAFLYYFQKKAAAEALDKITKQNLPAVLILAATGTGKTFIKGAITRRLLDSKFVDGKTWGQTAILNVTRATVVEQDKRVLNNFFGIKHPVQCETINIEQLRSRAGQMWISCKTVIQNGEEVEVYDWKPMINPVLVKWDECQALKNESSTQHKIACAFSSIPTPTTQLFISATPFTRVSEAKAFAIATKKDISHITGIPGSRLTASSWQTYAAAIAAPSPPDDYNEAAVERLMKDLDDYIVRVKGVRWQFNAINRVVVIDFDPPLPKNDMTDTRAEYFAAWQKYLDMMAKLEREVTDNPRFQALVQLGIFLAAAEYSKRYILAERMYNDVQNGKAAVCAVKFKKTIIAITKILNEKYGVPRDQITLVWGGGQTQLTAQQKLKQKVRENEDKFKELGLTMADLNLDQVEDRTLEDLPEHLRLGNQSKEERQREIDRFQSGRSLYAIYTYKAGGVGLSLHHTDELTREKVRRKPNGYAYEEDISKIPVRPRKATIGPTWSAIELVQGCGRCPRLTSLSDTEQEFLYFKGTVEEEQAFVVTHKLKCLSKVVRQHESWQDLITNHKRSKEIAAELVSKTANAESDEIDNDALVSTDEEEE